MAHTRSASDNQGLNQYEELNLDAIVKEWTKTVYDTSLNDGEKPLENSGYTVAIDYRRVKFIEMELEFPPDPKQGEPKTEIIYETVCQNKTKQSQKFSLKTTKTTNQVARYNIYRAIIANGKTKLRLSHLPKEIPRAAGFNSEVVLEGVGEHEVREAIQWQIDTLVDVPKTSSTKAEVVVNEFQHKAKFKASTKIFGNIHVDILDPANNNALKRSLDGDIMEALREFAGDNKSLTFEDSSAIYRSSGICEFRFGVEYNVILSPVNEGY